MPQWIKNFYCRLGWHKWEWEDYTNSEGQFTFARCTNEECSSHYWMEVNFEARKPW